MLITNKIQFRNSNKYIEYLTWNIISIDYIIKIITTSILLYDTNVNY